jgi:uncharacterized membrane protein YfcA
MSQTPVRGGGFGDEPIDVDAGEVPGGSDGRRPGGLLEALLGSAILSGLFGVGVMVLAAYFMFRAIVATVLWFCFDDALAAAVELPGVGRFEWWQVLLMVVFVSLVVGRRGAGPAPADGEEPGRARVRRRTY